MRYADCPSVDATIVVGAAPDRVWELVSDIAVIAALSRETKSVEWVDGAAGPALGSRFRGVNSHEAVGEWTTVSTVVVCDPARAFQWDVGTVESPAASWGYELTPVADGTQLRAWGRLGPGPSNLTKAIDKFPEKEERIVARRLDEFRVGVEKTLAGIKSLAES
ncbi:MAG TPA: SRPBCC family protein [Sporichthyaceae bacterium]|jgi:hypothetical protein|nr:SRPBCC family protein [Sporichthyaceae bacterium]